MGEVKEAAADTFSYAVGKIVMKCNLLQTIILRISQLIKVQLNNLLIYCKNYKISI